MERSGGVVHLIDLEAYRVLSPQLVHPSAMYDLIVKGRSFYSQEQATEARRALTQSLAWTAGVAMMEARPVGRVLDCQRAAKVWATGIRLAKEELESERALDAELEVETFVVVLATEYSRMLLGPDIRRLEAVHESELLTDKESLVPRLSSVKRYGLRLVPDTRNLEQHAGWLEAVAVKGLI